MNRCVLLHGSIINNVPEHVLHVFGITHVSFIDSATVGVQYFDNCECYEVFVMRLGRTLYINGQRL